MYVRREKRKDKGKKREREIKNVARLSEKNVMQKEIEIITGTIKFNKKVI